MRTRSVIAATAGIIAGVIIATTAIVTVISGDKSPLYRAIFKKGTEQAEEVQPDDGSYIMETFYDGSEPVDPVLFTYPFKKTQAYVSNKDCPTKFSRDTLHIYAEAAKFFAINTFGTGYRRIEEDPDAYIREVTRSLGGDTVIALDDGTQRTAAAAAEQLADWYRKNHVQADIQFETADCLVFYDQYMYVRGKLTVTSYNCDTNDSTPLLPAGMDMKNGGTYIMDIGMVYAGMDEGFHVMEYSIVADITGSEEE